MKTLCYEILYLDPYATGTKIKEQGSYYLGSDTMLVAPVSVGDGALTGSGSVITQDVPADAIALGRSKQVNRLGLAGVFFAKLRAAKSVKKGS